MKKKKKKILIFGMSSTVGGVENFILNLYEKIDKENIQIDFLVSNNLEGTYREKLIDKYHAKVHIVPSIKKNPFRCIKMIKKIALTENYDVVHVNLCSALLFSYILILKKYSNKNLKVITHSHSSGESNKIRKALHYLFKPFLIKNTNVFIACSKLAGKWMYGKKISNSSRLIIVKNAIDVDKFSYDDNKRLAFRRKNNYEENDFIIGHIGRFEEVKNHKFIIEMFHKYHENNKNSKLLLVGDGSLKSEIKSLVHSLNLDSSVNILDVSSNVDSIYQALDVFILPSLFEGLPTVGIEAQAADLPCVFSNNITIEADITGNVKFLPLDINEWVNCIDEISFMKKGRKKIKNKIIKSGYDLNTEILKIAKLYED